MMPSAARTFLLNRHMVVLQLVRLGIPFEVAQELTPAQRVAWLDAAEHMDGEGCIDDQVDGVEDGTT